MVDFDCKTKNMVVQPTPKLPTKKLPSRRSMPALTQPAIRSGEIPPASDSSCSAYESFFRIPELRQLWSSKEFPGWESESVIKPGLIALEITFRFISIILSDPRPYVNTREWARRLEGLVRDQLDLISILCDEDETRGVAPTVDLSSSFGTVVAHTGSSSVTEVWKMADHDTTVVSRTSESSLLPRLATWRKAEDLSSRIQYAVESAMKRCVYTLGLGEPNLDGKPNLDYDAVCRPSELHALKRPPPPLSNVVNQESLTLFTTHQIFETWVFTAGKILDRVNERITKKEFTKACDECWVLERIWKLLETISNLHLLMDPDDFLKLRSQLRMKTTSDSDTFCFRSRGLIGITKLSKDLRERVSEILAVHADPMAGPLVQEEAMKVYREKKEGRSFEKVQLLQAFQGVESAVKRFYYNYKQLLVIMMGSLEAKANTGGVEFEGLDMLAKIYLEPTYYPSLDGAKTSIGDFWEHDRGRQ